MRGLDPRIHLLKSDGLPGQKGVYARLRRAMPGNDDPAEKRRVANFPLGLSVDAELLLQA
jgi:hypothetical protein